MAISYITINSIINNCNLAIAAFNAGLKKANILKHLLKIIVFKVFKCLFKIPNLQKLKKQLLLIIKINIA